MIKIRGWYKTSKCKDGAVWFDTHYELATIIKVLEQDDTIQNYSTNKTTKINNKTRVISFYIEYKSGNKKILDAMSNNKTAQMLYHIQDLTEYAIANQIIYETIDEIQLGFSNNEELYQWTKKIRDDLPVCDSKLIQAVKRKETARKYAEKIAQDRILVFCEYCDDYHEIARKQYNNNINKNERYICLRESIETPKPGKKKENPFYPIGKKECVLCKQVLDLDNFGADKSRRDGLSSRCKGCRNKVAKENYNKENNNEITGI